MSSTGAFPGTTETTYILVTGANSGLGFAICCRLIDEFLDTRPRNEFLVLIFTTRSSKKGTNTLNWLHLHLAKHNARVGSNGLRNSTGNRVALRSEIVDLTNLLSVHALTKRLNQTLPKLDVVVLNAGIGGWVGMNWPLAIWTTLTDLSHTVTWPTFKLSSIGSVLKPQSADGSGEPPLGEVFTANVFGHYMLAHWLMPSLRSSKQSPEASRLIWCSSIESGRDHFNLNDLQGLRFPAAYESSKRLSDILALTFHLPSTRPWVERFLSVEQDGTDHKQESPKRSTTPQRDVRQFTSHPGISATSIVPLPYLLELLMLLAFYMARFLGSQWHPIRPYKGAVSMVWLALSPSDTLASQAAEKSKWGSATDIWGREMVRRTEVEGWGCRGDGNIVEKGQKGRKRGAKDATREDLEAFEEVGRGAWKGMEALREQWEERIVEGERRREIAEAMVEK